jgi:threonine dehydrogenase-like Zn-dependent dehydrogenase
MRIVCIGGGPAGLYFALLMKKLDPAHRITVAELRKNGLRMCLVQFMFCCRIASILFCRAHRRRGLPLSSFR